MTNFLLSAQTTALNQVEEVNDSHVVNVTTNITSQEVASISEGPTTNSEKEDDVDDSKDVLHLIPTTFEPAVTSVESIDDDVESVTLFCSIDLINSM